MASLTQNRAAFQLCLNNAVYRGGPGNRRVSVSWSGDVEGSEMIYSLQDLVVLDALLQILQVGVRASDRPHVGFKELDVPFLLQTQPSSVCSPDH